jgi:hypothetical protein
MKIAREGVTIEITPDELNDVSAAEVIALLDYSDVLDAITVEQDEYQENPTDWAEHIEARSLYNNWRGVQDWDHDRAGFTYGVVQGEAYIIEANCEPHETESYKFHRSNGASRQVAFELAAESLASQVEYTRQFYAQERCFWVACGEVDGIVWSCGGYDDEEYARQEVAVELTAGLEAVGYTVENQPAPEPRHSNGWYQLQ